MQIASFNPHPSQNDTSQNTHSTTRSVHRRQSNIIPPRLFLCLRNPFSLSSRQSGPCLCNPPLRIDFTPGRPIVRFPLFPTTHKILMRNFLTFMLLVHPRLATCVCITHGYLPMYHTLHACPSTGSLRLGPRHISKTCTPTCTSQAKCTGTTSASSFSFVMRLCANKATFTSLSLRHVKMGIAS